MVFISRKSGFAEFDSFSHTRNNRRTNSWQFEQLSIRKFGGGCCVQTVVIESSCCRVVEHQENPVWVFRCESFLPLQIFFAHDNSLWLMKKQKHHTLI